MDDGGIERRRYGRVRLDLAIPARFGERRVRVVELSLAGFLIAHERRSVHGETATLSMEPNGDLIDVACSVTRCTLAHLARGAEERSIYYSGLRVVAATPAMASRLRNAIAERVVRAIEEMQANANGIPPLAAYMYQPGKSDLYRRCELMHGVWRKTETSRPVQPEHGFTVSAELDPREIDMLCATWESVSAEGRRLTRMLAELSIDKTEGVPVRRYVP